MEATNSTQVLDLRDTVQQLGAGELTKNSFAHLTRAVFSNPKGLSELRELVSNWESVESAIPSRGTAAVLLGFCEYLLGELSEAEEMLAGQKRSEWGCFYLTRVLLDLQKVDEALQLVEDVHKRFPDSLPLAYQLIDVWCKTGWEEEVPKLLGKLEQTDSGSTEFAFYNGLFQERIGEYREAVELYREAVARDDQNSEAYFRLGYLLDLYGTESEEANEEAIQAYESCVKTLPPHTNAIINLGLLYEDRERYHDAAKCFETVLKAYPDHHRARLYLGDALAATRMFYDKEQDKKADRYSQVLKIPVTDFELSVRSRNCLQKMNIDTLGDLIMKTEQELLSYKNFGETSLQEIKEMLATKGLRLGQGLEDKGAEVPAGRNPLEATVSPEILDKPIEELNLSVRSRRCMERLEVGTVRDLINKTEVELMSAKNFGMTSLNEIKRKLAEVGLALRS